jgi:hypothetical protein
MGDFEMSFEDDLAAAQAEEVAYANVEVTVRGNLYVIRITQMDPFEWASEVDRHPARDGVAIDQRYGYNLRSLTKAVVPVCGKRVDGDELVDVQDWPALLKAIGGYGFQRVSDAVWALNEILPERAVEAAKKALIATRKSSA